MNKVMCECEELSITVKIDPKTGKPRATTKPGSRISISGVWDFDGDARMELVGKILCHRHAKDKPDA